MKTLKEIKINSINWLQGYGNNGQDGFLYACLSLGIAPFIALIPTIIAINIFSISFVITYKVCVALCFAIIFIRFQIK